MKINIKYKLPFFFALLLVFGVIGCETTTPQTEQVKKEVDPFETAMPHGATLPEQQLSKADQAKLANAIGKSVQEISFKELLAQFDEAYNKLLVVSFWKLDCDACKNVNRNLQQIQHELGNDKMRLSFINLDEKQDQATVNTYIRANNLTSEVFMLKKKRPKNWKSKIIRSWEGELPALYLINKSDGTDFFYQQEMSYEELLAIIQTLSI
ncbi:MAG: TlpA family protein disulfide reductase [Saprospiraceae bacterium]